MPEFLVKGGILTCKVSNLSTSHQLFRYISIVTKIFWLSTIFDLTKWMVLVNFTIKCEK